jgi:hypothetical protein
MSRRTLKVGHGRLLTAALCVGLAAGPGSVSAARAAKVPVPDACVGLGNTFFNSDAHVLSASGTLFCGLHTYSFAVATSSAPDLCLGGDFARVAFIGTVNKDFDPPVPASMKIAGASGVYLVTMQAGQARWIGGLISAVGLNMCDATSAPLTIVAAEVPPSAPLPVALACRASGTVGPNIISTPRSGPVGDGGPISGSGTCISMDGRWDLTYTGDWGGTGPDQSTACPGAYNVYLTATSRANGRTVKQYQSWVENSKNGMAAFVATSVGLAGVGPVGVGTIKQSPDPCTLPASMTTVANWVLFVPS